MRVRGVENTHGDIAFIKNENDTEWPQATFDNMINFIESQEKIKKFRKLEKFLGNSKDFRTVVYAHQRSVNYFRQEGEKLEVARVCIVATFRSRWRWDCTLLLMDAPRVEKWEEEWRGAKKIEGITRKKIESEREVAKENRRHHAEEQKKSGGHEAGNRFVPLISRVCN